MTYFTYHTRRMMDRQSLHQLSFYGENKRICHLMEHAGTCCGDDIGELGGDDDDGYNRGAGGGAVSKRTSPPTSRQRADEAIRKVVNVKGGVHWERVRNTSISYVLHMEKGPHEGKPQWRLRLVQGLPDATHEEFKLSPLHFACAGRHREIIILLLQKGGKNTTASFYQNAPMCCSAMLGNDQNFQKLFSFWAAPPSEHFWRPTHHAVFPEAFKRAAKAVMFALSRVTCPHEKQRLCNDLMLSVVQWLPTDVMTLTQWWPRLPNASSTVAGARKRQRSPPSA
eukprot:TRINITY_DN6810_c0_g2_i1.p1 TRINITY_DN6810_c0_g2~~TRINITY_DN6810_c0_g2_i1.p1  ORF type:complete len:282 (+),score=49.78 TRINITY_DN6810_c0_g2_i1:696-1541(+)